MNKPLNNCSTKTTCPYCGVGCGVEVSVKAALNEVQVKAKGDANHPANFGKLCVKGSNLLQTLTPQGRPTQPYIQGKPVEWNDAIHTIAGKIKDVIAKHGPDAFAFYLSGQLLTEDYYVANKLAKGFIGTANVDTNSRLCMASAVVGYKRAFGSDTVPCNYEDLEQCDLLIMVGSNAAWTHPVLYQRIVAAKKNNPAMKVVVIDPRKTASCDVADLHLAISPGSDAALFNYLLNETAQNNALNIGYVKSNTEGFDQALAQAKPWTQQATASFCGVSEQALQCLSQWWCSTPKTVTFFSQGINQSATGVDKSNAIINCHLATGRIGQVGMGPFSITGQPNAMGGREVGGLANQLAAHMDFTTPGAIDRVKRFWQAPKMATQNGLKAVDLFKAIEAGDVKIVWIMATNPVVSLPDSAQVRRALKKCDLVIVSECYDKTDTTEFADVLLPATGWSEKNGTVTNSERRISRQHSFEAPKGEAKHDWQAICDVAIAMGYSSEFSYQGVHEIFAEHAGLSVFENNGTRDFDIGHFSQISEKTYNEMKPVQWPVPIGKPEGTDRMFENGQFFTHSGRANFVPIKPQKPAEELSNEFPLTLNTGRIRDQWHTMTRTGRTSKLMGHIEQPFIDISPQDAAHLSIVQLQIVEVVSQLGSVKLRANIRSTQKKGQVFAPIHWTDQFANNAVISNLINATVDPLSGQPESKFAQVAIRPVEKLLYGYCISQKKLNFDDAAYWCHVTLEQGAHTEFALQEASATSTDLFEKAKSLLSAKNVDIEAGEWVVYSNPIENVARFSFVKDDVLIAAFYFSQHPMLPSTQWLREMVTSQAKIEQHQRLGLLAGKPSNGVDHGRIVCSCFNVGENQINDALEQGVKNLADLTRSLKCGSNCGSCLPELSDIIDSKTIEHA
ncbi:molybdopterin-dependent oxidoreductase [Reinekea forsetii]|nr:molybdopterin-dependent oxidoreductase [Reinekea forsetii]